MGGNYASLGISCGEALPVYFSLSCVCFALGGAMRWFARILFPLEPAPFHALFLAACGSFPFSFFRLWKFVLELVLRHA